MLLHLKHIGDQVYGGYAFADTNVDVEGIWDDLGKGVSADKLIEKNPKIKGIRFNMLNLAVSIFKSVDNNADIYTTGVSNSGKYFCLRVDRFTVGDYLCSFAIEHFYGNGTYTAFVGETTKHDELFETKEHTFDSIEDVTRFVVEKSREFLVRPVNLNNPPLGERGVVDVTEKFQ